MLDSICVPTFWRNHGTKKTPQLCPILNSPRLQAHILVGDCLRGHGLCRHLPLQQHHRLHERDRGDDGGHDDGPPLRGLLSLRGCLQYQPGVGFKMFSGVNKKRFFY